MTRLLSTAFLCLCLATPAAGAADRIGFREQAKVAHEEMTLGELAELGGGCAALADVPMGRAPEPGKALVLSRAELLSKLSVAVPRGSVEVACPPHVVAVRGHQVVSRARMVEALKAALSARLAGGGEVSVSGFKVAEEPQVPEGKLDLLFELPGGNDRCLGNVNLALVCRVDGKFARKLRTSAAVSLRRQVACAARTIERHAVLEDADITMESRELNAGEPVQSIEAAVGKRAGRRIEAGSVVLRRDLEQPPVLSKGTAVTLLIESGPLTIATRGTACEGGRVGDTVRVMNADSKREVLAVIVDGATVRVPFER